jgi:hypothetical protein
MGLFASCLDLNLRFSLIWVFYWLKIGEGNLNFLTSTRPSPTNSCARIFFSRSISPLKLLCSLSLHADLSLQIFSAACVIFYALPPSLCPRCGAQSPARRPPLPRPTTPPVRAPFSSSHGGCRRVPCASVARSRVFKPGSSSSLFYGRCPSLVSGGRPPLLLPCKIPGEIGGEEG